jgi:hypothetical protein
MIAEAKAGGASEALEDVEVTRSEGPLAVGVTF